MDELELEDDLKKRRRKLIEASKTPRTKEEVKKVLEKYKAKGFEVIVDDKECTITRTFSAMVVDPSNNKAARREEVSLTVSGNLYRPIEDFDHDARWLMAQAGSIMDAQKGIISRR